MADADLNGMKVTNLVTSRKPDDIPAFNREMIALFGSVRGGQTTQAAG